MHNSEQKRGTAVLAVLAVLCFVSCFSADISDVCLGLKSVSLAPTAQQHFVLPDSIEGISISNAKDLAWICPSDCPSGSLSENVTSPWISSSICVSKQVDEDRKCSQQQMRTVITASLDSAAHTFTASARTEFKFDLTISGTTVPVSGQIGFFMKDIPVALLGRAVPVWTGSLYGSANGITVADSDLFDGVSAVVYQKSESGSPTPEMVSSIKRVAQVSANIAGRVKFFEMVPSALAGDVTARMAFPNSFQVIDVQDKDVKMLGGDLAYAPVTATCEGVDCGPAVKRVLENFAASGGVCINGTMKNVFSTLSVIIAANGTNHNVISSHAWVQGSVQCDNNGFVLVTLEAVSDADGSDVDFRTNVFVEDDHAAVTMTKSISVSMTGSRVAVVNNGDKLMTTMEGDLFGNKRGGLFVVDSAITKSTEPVFKEAVDSFINKTHTRRAALDAELKAYFTNITADTVFNNYFDRTATPTANGLWQYWANQFLGLDVLLDDSNTGLVADVDLTLRNAVLNYSTNVAIYDAMNVVLEALYDELGGATLNRSKPVLTDKNNYTTHIIDGAVSATIPLPALSATSFLRGDDGEVESWAIATVDADFEGNCILKKALMSLILGQNDIEYTPSVDYAVLYDGSAVARSSANVLIYDDIWAKEKIKGVADSLWSVMNQTDGNLSSSVDQLHIVTEGSNVTYTMLVNETINILTKMASGNASITSVSVMKDVREGLNKLVDNLHDKPFIGHFSIIPVINDGRIDFVFDIFALRHIYSDAQSDEWKRTIPLPRLHVETPTKTNLTFYGRSTNESALITFTQKGESSVSGWSLPVRSGMRSGIVSGSASLSINFPESAQMIIELSGNMDRGGAISAHFEGNMTVHMDDDDPTKLPSDFFFWNFTEKDRGDYAQSVAPELVVHSFFDNSMIMSTISSFRLSTPMPPFSDPLGSFFDTSNLWENERSYFYTDDANPVLAAAKIDVNATDVEEDYNFTVNGDKFFMNCTMSFDGLTPDNALKLFTDFVDKCGLSDYVKLEFIPDSEDDDDDDENDGSVPGRIVFLPLCSGLIHSFKVSAANATTASPLKSQSWKSGLTMPDTLSWNDFYDSVYAIFFRDNGIEYSLPVIENITMDDLELVNETRQLFYPDRFPAVMFPVSYSMDYDAKDVHVMTSVESRNIQSHFNPPEDFTMPVSIHAEVKTVFGYALWCSLGDGILNISTSFDGANESFNSSRVPDAPNNTFTITFTYETRHSNNPGAVPPVTTHRQSITLTPGNLVGEELMNNVVSAITDPNIQSMLLMTKQDDPIRAPGLDQVVMTFMPYVTAGNESLFVPLSISIDISDIPNWGNNNSAVVIQTMSTCPVNKNFETNFHVYTNPSTNDEVSTTCSGITGILGANASALLNTDQNYSANTKSAYEFQVDLISSAVNDELFDKFFNSVASVATTVDMSDFAFENADLSGDIGSQVLRFVFEKSNLTFNNLSAIDDFRFDTDIVSGAASALALSALSNTTRADLCEALRLADNASSLFSQDPDNQVSLPFVDSSIGPLFRQRLGEILSTVKDTVCSDSGELTLDPFCQTLSSGWGVEACANISIDDKSLSLYVTAEPPSYKVDAGFKFDVERLIPEAHGKNLTAGIGADGDFVLIANASASFGIRFALSDGKNETNGALDKWKVTVDLDPEHTKFHAGASVDTNAQVKASFGSIQINFLSANIHLDAHADAAWLGKNNISLDIDGTASMDTHVSLEPILSCDITAKIPSILDFIHDTNKTEFSQKCAEGETFVELLEALVDDMSLIKYFEQDPSLFWKQFSKDLDAIFEQLIQQLLNRAVTFIGKQLQGLVHKALDKITGPEVAAAVGKDIADMVAHVILNHTAPTPTELEQIVLDVFTGILNKNFGPYLMEPLVPPVASEPEYRWKFRFGNITTKPLTNIDFHLGGHGLAQFGLRCQPELQLKWQVSFDAIWSKQKGISIEWQNPAILGEVTIQGSQQCEMEGRLLYMGALLKADMKCDVTLKVVTDEQKKLHALDFTVDSSITGLAEIGLVGILQDKVDSIPSSLPALPHVKTELFIDWGIINFTTDGGSHNSPIHFVFNGTQLCLGTMLTKFMKRITDEIDKVTKPLDPVFGPNGVLLRKVDALKPFLGNHNDLLGILELMCQFYSKSCNVDGVRQLCNTLRMVGEILDKLEQFDKILTNPEGCADVTYWYNTFHVDWSKDDPQPQPGNSSYSGLAVRDWQDGEFIFDPSIPFENRSTVQKTVTDFETGGEFQFHLDILNQFPTKLIQILLGQNVALFSFSFPYARFSFSTSWSIPVWAFPYIEIVIEASAALEFRPPPIALMSNAVVDTIRTHNPSHIFRNFALRAKENGDPFFFLKGTVELGGGVGVGLSIYVISITGEATIFIRVTAGVAVASPTDDEWTTFDAIALQLRQKGVAGTVDIEIVFTGGFRLALKACIHILFGKHCWTFASVSWSKDFGSLSFKPDHMNALSDTSGNIDGNAANLEFQRPSWSLSEVNEPDYARFTITPTDVLLLTRGQNDADASLQRSLSSNPSVHFSGSEVCQGPIAVSVVGDVNFPILLPDCDKAQLNVSQYNYESSDMSFSLTANTLFAGNRQPMTFAGVWDQVYLIEPDYGTTYDISGKPTCSVTIETEALSTLSIHGKPSDYKSGPIKMVGGLEELDATVLCSDFNVDNTLFNCTSNSSANVVNVEVPVGLRSFTAVASTSEWSVFHILGVPAGRSSVMTSATDYTNFSIPDMSLINGDTQCIGNSAGQMYLLATMKTPDSASAVIRLSSSTSQLDNGDGLPHIVRHTNVPLREFDIYGSNSNEAETQSVMMSPQDFDVVTLRSHGYKNSHMTHYITGCHVPAVLRVEMDGDGEQSIMFGDKDGMNKSMCTASVMSLSDSVTSTIGFNALRDDRRLRWEFTDGSISLKDLDGQTSSFQVLHSGIKRVIVNFSYSKQSEVIVNTVQDETEFVFNFPESADGVNNNTLAVISSPASILVNGSVSAIAIGANSQGMSQTPFSDIHGVIAVSKDTVITIDSSAMSNPVDHAYSMDELCLADEVALSKTKMVDMTEWFVDQLRISGMSVPTNSCSLLYNSKATQSIILTTGKGADNFTAVRAAIPVTMDLDANIDRVSLMDVTAPFVVKLGDGADYLEIGNTYDVDADLGADKMTDTVRVHYRSDSPNIDGTMIYPVGPNNSTLTLHNWLQQDLLSVVRDGDGRTLNNRFRAGFGSPVNISNNNSGSTITYEEAPDTVYLIVGCASMAVISLDVHSSSGGAPAKNAVAYVYLSNMSSRCFVNINSEIDMNGTCGILAPHDMKTVPTLIHTERSDDPVGSGLISFGGLELRPTNISHIEISVPDDLPLSDDALVDINGIPNKADVIVNVPGVQWKVNVNSLHTTAVILDARTEVLPEVITAEDVSVILGGKLNVSRLDLNATGIDELTLVSGCVRAKDNGKVRSLSDWIYWRTLTEYEVDLGHYHKCSVEVHNSSAVRIVQCPSLRIGGLSHNSTPSVLVADTPNLTITIDPKMDDPNLTKAYGAWSSATFKGMEFSGGYADFSVTRDDGEQFEVTMLGLQNLIFNRDVTLFTNKSRFELDWLDNPANMTINMFDEFSDEDEMQVTLKVASNNNNFFATINNAISKNTSISPAIVLGKGLSLDLDVKMLGPSGNDDKLNVPDFGKNYPVRVLEILDNSTINRASYVLTEVPAGSSNPSTALINISWDDQHSKKIQQEFSDNARYVLDFDELMIDSQLVKMSVASASLLSFGDLHGSTVLFLDAKTTDYKPKKREFSLTHSNSKNDYCFDPCQDCTDGAWSRVVIAGKVCQPRDAQESCKKRAKVSVKVTGKLEPVACGAAAYDNERNESCAFAMNVHGLETDVLTVPDSVMTGTTIVIAASIFFTIIGASSLVARLVFSCRHYSNINIWWTRNSFRDLLTDQFSWAAIVITACLPEVSDVDYADWGGWVVAIMMRAKTFVLNWFVECSDDGEPVWVTPATIVFWCVTIVTVIMRIVEIILKKRDITLNDTVKNTMLALQSILTVTGFLLMPLAGYSIAFIQSNSYAAFASIACMVLLFASQPIGGVKSRTCVTGIVVSIVNVLLPVAMCIYVGVGADFLPLIIMALSFTILLPVIDTAVLWFSFFRQAPLRNTAWKHSIGWTTSLRILSTLCGLAFLVMLFYELSETVSKIAAGLWFGWVCLPFLSVIPLTVGVPSILSASEVVHTRKPLMASGKVDESSPLLGSVPDADEAEQL